MHIDSKKVAQRFDRAYSSYRKSAIVQAQMAQQLLANLAEFLPNKSLGRVLEIGVGSGFVTDCLLDRYRVQTLYLNDLYETIKQNPLDPKPESCQYLLGDIRSLQLPDGLDLVLSSAVFQWLYPLDTLLEKIHQSLPVGAYVAVGSFTQGNLAQIKKLTGQGLSYDTPDMLQARFERAGFVVDRVLSYEQTLYFDSPMAVLKHLKATGVTASSGSFYWNKQRLDKFCQAYQKLATAQGIPLSYQPVLLIAHKN